MKTHPVVLAAAAAVATALVPACAAIPAPNPRNVIPLDPQGTVQLTVLAENLIRLQHEPAGHNGSGSSSKKSSFHDLATSAVINRGDFSRKQDPSEIKVTKTGDPTAWRRARALESMSAQSTRGLRQIHGGREIFARVGAVDIPC